MYYIFRSLAGHIFIPGCALYAITDIEMPDVEHIFDEKCFKSLFINQIFIRFKGTKIMSKYHFLRNWR